MAREPQKSTKSTSKSKTDTAASKQNAGAENQSQKENPDQSGAELLKAQHQELQSVLAKRSEANADRSTIVKEFAALWLPHQLTEEEVLVPALRESGFDETKIIANEVRKDLINILLADLLQDDDEESSEPRLEALAVQFDALVQGREGEDEGVRAAFTSGGSQSSSLSTELKSRYEEAKQRFADIDENFGRALSVLAPRRLSIPSRQSQRGSGMAGYRDDRDREYGRMSASRGQSSSQRENYEGGGRQSRGRYGDDERSYGGRSMSRGRDYDDDRRYGGGGESGRGSSGYGYPEGRFEGARRGTQSRGREYDEDERYGRGFERGGRSGWYGDPEGHSEASRRGWESRERENNESDRYGGSRRGEEQRSQSGWFGDPEGHSRAARRGWDESRGESSSGPRTRSRYDDDRRSPRGGGGRSGSDRY